MSDYTCPICSITYKEDERRKQWAEKDPCKVDCGADTDFIELYCHHFNFRFFLHNNIYYTADGDLKEKLLNLVAEHLNHNRTCVIDGETRLWYFFYNNTGNSIYCNRPNYVNLANQLSNYPTQAIDVALRSLVNYALRYPHYGDTISPNWRDRRLSFEHKMNNNHSCGVMKLLLDLGYVKDPDNTECYSISAAGWLKIDELQKEEQIIHQGFIAMSFREETKPIREAFRTAMQESGYSVAVIDEKEHNNQIVPEIFYEIERSKFVVVDVTYPNYGAYYEAGYAQALGKQVIICCRKAEFDNKENPDRPHFDISQKSMVVWKDEADLIQRLKRRIEATVR
jgi:nucleoside 2-deoxyribosyltransferase